MTVVEEAPVVEGKATPTRNRRGESWDAAYERIQRERPSSKDGECVKDMPLPALLKLIGDIGTVGEAWGVGTGARGGRPRVRDGRASGHDPEVVTDSIRKIMIDGCGVGLGPHIAEAYTTEPFADAFRYMVGQRSAMQMSRRTEIHPRRILRLLSGRYLPTGTEMEAIARTFSKQPWYFREYRSVMIAAMVLGQMDREPERSAVIARLLVS